MQHKILAWPRAVKRLVVVTMDVVLSLLATWLAFTLRLDALHWPDELQLRVYVLAPLLAIPIFIRLGLYRAIFRYTGQAALMTTAKAVAIYGVLLLGVVLWARWDNVPRSVGVLQPLIFLLLVGASRAMARFWLSGAAHAPAGQGRFLIYGAGMAGVQTAAGLGMGGPYKLLGFIDDDPGKVGRSINGALVYSSQDLPALVAREAVTDVLLALPSVSRDRRNRILERLRPMPVHIRTLPGLADLTSGRVTVQDFQELDIEDLLGRDPVPPDTALLASQLAGKVVLVTGAGGSIGSELCRQIVRENPRQLLLLDHSEFALYSIHQELEGISIGLGKGVALLPLLGSVTNKTRLHEICRHHRPDVVFHAAAYKHVPLVESNPAEGISNNVFGTFNMARAAQDSGVASFVLVSTDKAVRPTNVMGASKRMAELVLQAMAAQGQGSTCFSMVRFGNVLGSSGSVVPLFRKQLETGGPLTVTHPDVTRYFMTIPEAAQLVLQAGAMAQGGEVFVLDMGSQVRILDLARRMAELSGLSVRDSEHPQGDIEIAITGLRPGEKLYEELLIGDNPSPTAHARIMKAHEDFMPWAELSSQLTYLQEAAQAGDAAAIRAVLQTCVQGFHAPASALAAQSDS